jgi:hypothetical protein
MAERFRTTPVLAAVVLGACGTRTGLLLAEQNTETQGDSIQDASTAADVGGDDAYEGGGVFCALYAGPVASCDAGAAAGPVQRCNTDTPYSKCTRIFEPGGDKPDGQWGCCWPDPPEGVNECLDRQFFADANCL